MPTSSPGHERLERLATADHMPPMQWSPGDHLRTVLDGLPSPRDRELHAGSPHATMASCWLYTTGMPAERR
eukprot:5418134-Prorocentrum_lima.AAC.1